MSLTSNEIKARMHQIFHTSVLDAKSYETVYANYMEVKNYIVFQKRTMHNYIVGFRHKQRDMVIVAITSDLQLLDEPCYISQENKQIVRKDFQQRWVIQAENTPKYKLTVIPAVSKLLATAYMLPVEQHAEAAAFHDFIKIM